MNAKLPPHSTEAERAVLGTIIEDQDSLGDALPALTEGLFYDLQHRTIFATIRAMAGTGVPVDSITLAERLRADGQLDAVGGLTHLSDICDLSSPATLDYLVELLGEKARLRAALKVCTEYAGRIYADTGEADDLLTSFERDALGIRASGAEQGEHDARGMVAAMFRRLESGVAPVAVRTGFRRLDAVLRMRPGQLVVCAARPSVGKTSFGLAVANHVALCHGMGVGFVSLEMGADELCQRMASGISGVPFGDFEDFGREAPEYLREERDIARGRVEDALGRIQRANFRVHDRGGATISTVGAVARRWKQRYDTHLLVLDYLGLIQPDVRARSRYEGITEISGRLKGLARELGVVVLCLAQLNRVAADGDDPPRMHHLRDSGAIEQDADAILLLHPTGYDGPWRNVTLGIEKQRNGGLGEIEMRLHGPTMRFSELCPVTMEDIP